MPKLFREIPPIEFIEQLLQTCGIHSIDDPSWFQKQQIHIEQFEQLLPELEPFYIPCKAQEYLYTSLSQAIGAEGGKRKYGMTFKKPDLRKDAGKSYTDTIQYSFQGSNERNPRNVGGILYSDKLAQELLNKLGVKGQRTLAKDKEAVQR